MILIVALTVDRVFCSHYILSLFSSATPYSPYRYLSLFLACLYLLQPFFPSSLLVLSPIPFPVALTSALDALQKTLYSRR